MDPILTVSAGNVTSMLDYSGKLFTDLAVVIILVIGLPLAFWVIKRIIGLVRAR